MSHYTHFSISRWILLGPRAGLVLILILGLLLGVSVPSRSHPRAPWIWLEAAAPQPLRLRPSRVGRWVWRLSRLVSASFWPWACRVGLLASVLAASDLPSHGTWVWHWLWVPVADWLLALVGALWPQCGLNPWYQDGCVLVRRAYQLSVLGLGCLALERASQRKFLGVLGSAVIVGERDGSRVALEATVGADGRPTYHLHLTGEFVYTVTPRDEFEKRLVLLDLRRLRTPGRETSPWGVVTQEALATVFGVTQEEISRWQRYVREGQWAQLLSLQENALLTDDLRQQIVAVWAPNLWQTAAEVRARLAAQGVAVAQRVVEEAGRQSGLRQMREHLKAQWVNAPDGLRPRDDYIVQQLFRLVEQLQAQGEGRLTAPVEQGVDVVALRQLAGCAEPEKRLAKPWPWLFQVEHWVFGDWQSVDDGTVRCSSCGSDQVAVKSKKPRRKVYRDVHGAWQTAEVYRYYCKNPDCRSQTFTNLPPGVVAYSTWTLDARLKGLELYTGLRTTYRGAAVALGVAPSTLYHWLAQWGTGPLQVAALFGLVRSSGVVGIDEKYVQVPKNAKPAGKQRQWMYVYVAVDAHTLDLLHIRIFPHLGKDSARTFLLELRAKGYHPTVIVTDLSQDYAEPLAAVFPQAVHHECVFHALQYWHRSFKDTFGRDYAETRPELVQVRQQLDQIFQARTRRTVEKRYAAFLAQRESQVDAEPRLAALFDSVVRHYPWLVNAYDHPLIPLTNNATERLIRRFDQHYQNFAGFDSLETAQSYLHLFELTYRFTPFGTEVQPHLRGKCPLELAGYDLTKIPLARYLREHATAPLLPPPAGVVPK